MQASLKNELNTLKHVPAFDVIPPGRIIVTSSKAKNLTQCYLHNSSIKRSRAFEYGVTSLFMKSAFGRISVNILRKIWSNTP